MATGLHYGQLMHRAMRGLIQEVLTRVAADGLPGDHHFFITFDTRHPGVEIADWLTDRYPEEMTIVMQHWFENLEVDDDGFAVTLNFGDAPERLSIAYDAILTFVDPSVEFGLRFEEQSYDDDGDAAEDDASANSGDDPDNGGSDPASNGGRRKEAEIVSLDRFRK